MKIAFDVKGTLNGPYSDRVVKFLRYCQAQGHEVFVWSSVYDWALEWAKTLNLKTDKGFAAQSKTEKWDLDTTEDPQSHYVDIAVDDDKMSTYLAAKRFIWVCDLPDGEENFAALLQGEVK